MPPRPRTRLRWYGPNIDPARESFASLITDPSKRSPETPPTLSTARGRTRRPKTAAGSHHANGTDVAMRGSFGEHKRAANRCAWWFALVSRFYPTTYASLRG